jgi:hypothetical protein
MPKTRYNRTRFLSNEMMKTAWSIKLEAWGIAWYIRAAALGHVQRCLKFRLASNCFENSLTFSFAANRWEKAVALALGEGAISFCRRCESPC